MPEINISEEGVLSLLRKLDFKKSSGPDCITNNFLFKYSEWISKYLYNIYTAKISTSIIPDNWRSSKIKLIHKSG